MSRKTVDNIRTGKPFRPLDLALYGGIALAVIALFMALVFFVPHSDMSRVFIDLRGDRLAVYDFDAGKLTVTSGKEAYAEVKKQDGKVQLTVWTDEEHKGYNVIEIDPAARTVKVTDANCSNHKDCVFSPAVTSSSGMIVCVPHGVKVYGDGLDPSLG